MWLYLMCMTSAVSLVLPASLTEVDIRVPPSIIKQTSPHKRVQILQEDEETVLDCVADGFPAPEYEWKFNGDPLDLNDAYIIPEGEGASIRVIVTPLRVGFYQCFAWNQYGKTMTDMIHLLRAVLYNFPPIIPNVDLVVEEGDPLIVPCNMISKSVPEPTYRWATVVHRDDNNPETFTLSRRIQQDEKGNLYFSHIRRGDEANSRLYKCVATNLYFGGAKYGSYTNIRVIQGSGSNKAPSIMYKAPSIMYYTGNDSGSDVIAIRGQTLRLQCLFSGKPAPQVSWNRPGGTLPSDRVRYEAFNTVMLIDDVDDADEATYRCIATGSGSSFQDIKVDVQSVPGYLTEEDRLYNLNVTEGKDAVFRCDTYADPPAQVEWFMNGEVITCTNKPDRVVFEEYPKVLRVVDVCKDCPGPKLTDIRVFQCNASNAHGYLFTSGYLNVILPTTVVTAPNSTVLQYGEEVRFECEGTSDDSTPIMYSWLKNNKQILYKPREIEHVVENDVSSLIITTKYLAESGREYVADYTCVITNGYTTVDATAELVAPPPTISTGVVVLSTVSSSAIVLVLCFCIYKRKSFLPRRQTQDPPTQQELSLMRSGRPTNEENQAMSLEVETDMDPYDVINDAPHHYLTILDVTEAMPSEEGRTAAETLPKTTEAPSDRQSYEEVQEWGHEDLPGRVPRHDETLAKTVAAPTDRQSYEEIKEWRQGDLPAAESHDSDATLPKTVAVSEEYDDVEHPNPRVGNVMYAGLEDGTRNVTPPNMYSSLMK